MKVKLGTLVMIILVLIYELIQNKFLDHIESLTKSEQIITSSISFAFSLLIVSSIYIYFSFVLYSWKVNGELFLGTG